MWNNRILITLGWSKLLNPKYEDISDALKYTKYCVLTGKIRIYTFYLNFDMCTYEFHRVLQAFLQRKCSHFPFSSFADGGVAPGCR